MNIFPLFSPFLFKKDRLFCARLVANSNSVPGFLCISNLKFLGGSAFDSRDFVSRFRDGVLNLFSMFSCLSSSTRIFDFSPTRIQNVWICVTMMEVWFELNTSFRHVLLPFTAFEMHIFSSSVFALFQRMDFECQELRSRFYIQISQLELGVTMISLFIPK